MTRRRAILQAVVVLLIVVPVFPELFGLSGITPFAQLVAFRPQGLVLVLVAGLLVGLRRSWRLLGVLVVAVAVVGALLTAPRVLSDPAKVPGGSTELTVMAANVLGGGADPDRVAALIREHRPSFVSLPEATVETRQQIENRITDLGYRGFTDQTTDSAVSATSALVAPELGAVRLSRAAELPELVTRFGGVVVTGGRLGELKIVAFHSYPPVPAAVGTWHADLDVLGRRCADGEPMVVAGDFNATLDHAAFREALGECRSVAAKVGKGLDGTWPAHRPAVLRTQIDHVVVTPGITPRGFATYDLDGSDHRAVVATIAVGAG